MIWITRSQANVDRIACPWLIKRFIDPDAQFLFVPRDEVLETARRLGGRSFDLPDADYTHQHAPEGELCTFVVLLHAFDLWGKDAALDEVGRIVNHADTSPETTAYTMPEGDGLRAVAHGFALQTRDDHQKLAWESPLYDALYAYCKRKTGA